MAFYETQQASDVNVTGVDASQITDAVNTTISGMLISCSRGDLNPRYVNADWFKRIYGAQSATDFADYDNSVANALHALGTKNAGFIKRVVAEDARYPTALLSTLGFNGGRHNPETPKRVMSLGAPVGMPTVGMPPVGGSSVVYATGVGEGILSPKVTSAVNLLDQISDVRDPWSSDGLDLPITKTDVLFHSIGPGLNTDISIEIDSKNFDPYSNSTVNVAKVPLFPNEVFSFATSHNRKRAFYVLTAITEKGEIPLRINKGVFSELTPKGEIDLHSSVTDSTASGSIPITQVILGVDLDVRGNRESTNHKIVFEVTLPDVYRCASAIRLYRLIVEDDADLSPTNIAVAVMAGETIYDSRGQQYAFTLIREQNPLNFLTKVTIEDKGTVGREVALPTWFGTEDNDTFVETLSSIIGGNDTYTVNVYDKQYKKGATPAETYVVAFHNKTSTSGDNLEIENVINKTSILIRCKNLTKLQCTTLPYVAPVTLTGGSEGSNYYHGTPVTKATVQHTTQDYLNAIMGFANYDKYPLAFILDFGNCQDEAYYMLLSQLATYLKAHVLFSCPRNKQQAGSFELFARSLPRNAFSSVYGPWLVGANTISGGTKVYAPAAWTYRLACDSDRSMSNNGRSFAGLNRGVTDALYLDGAEEEFEYDELQRDTLKLANANYFQRVEGVGIVLKEQRTLNSINSHASWVNVSRVWATLQRMCKSKWAYSLQEPNDSFLVKQITMDAQKVAETYLNSRDLKKVIIYADERAGNNQETLERAIRNIDVIIEANLATDRIHGRIILSKNAVEFVNLEGVTTQTLSPNIGTLPPQS